MSRLSSLRVGSERGIGHAVYGTVLALAALAAGTTERRSPIELALLVATTAFVIWFAHVYAHGLGESIERRRPLDAPELVAMARRELPILIAAVAPIAGLLLGVVGLVRTSTSIWIAFGVGLAALGAYGARYARVEHLGRLGTAAVIAANVALGLLVVALKVLVLH